MRASDIRRPARARPSPDPLPFRTTSIAAPGGYHLAQFTVERGALAAILKEWPAALPSGHIHADLFPDNVFFLDGRVSGLIDFYFAATDLLAYDIAICLNAWCFEPDISLNVTKARLLLSSYDAVRPLSAAERAALPVLCQGAALRFLLTRLFDWVHTPPGAMVTRKDPMEYLHKLRFFGHAATAEALGG